MKRNFFKSVVLSFCFLAGVLQANAQNASQMEPFNPEIQALAAEVLTKVAEDPDQANKVFSKLLRKCKTNSDQLYHASRYFLENKNYQCAKMCADRAYTNNAQSVDILLLRGEIAEMVKNWGAAGQAYEEILQLDPNNVAAMKKIADTYKYVNPEVAKEYLNKVKELDPNDVEVDKNLGLIYYRADEMKPSAKYYGAYYKATPVDQVDIFSCTQYVNALFMTQSYARAIKVCNEVGPRDPENKVFKSVKFWSLVENYELPQAREAMTYITNKEYPDSTYIYWDYYYAGRLSKDEGNMADAIKYQKLAVESDTARAAGYLEMNNLYQENKQYAEALPYYKEYLKKLKELNRAQATDTFKLGYLYFTLAQVDSVKREDWVKDGDAIFEYVSNSAPDSYMGPIFRARISNVTAGGTEVRDNVRDFYIEALKRIGDNNKAKNDKLECLQYLAFYDIQKDNYPEALQYLLQMEAVDPENGFVKRVKPFVESQITQ